MRELNVSETDVVNGSGVACTTFTFATAVMGGTIGGIAGGVMSSGIGAPAGVWGGAQFGLQVGLAMCSAFDI